MEAEGSVEVIDLDLNEEPAENYQENMESVYTRIEERIRQLEAVTLRARQRQEWRLANEAVNEETLSLNGESAVAIVDVPREVLSSVPERVPREALSSAPDSHLLALALELEGEAREKKNSGEAFFDCNICLAKARDPVLTCCGHLYCWPCFYQLPDVGTEDTKECPACEGEVKLAAIIPIYGSSDKALKRKVEGSGVKIPPRPQAPRIESLRQQRISRGSSASRIEEVLRGLRSFSTLSRNLSPALHSCYVSISADSVTKSKSLSFEFTQTYLKKIKATQHRDAVASYFLPHADGKMPLLADYPLALDSFLHLITERKRQKRKWVEREARKMQQMGTRKGMGRRRKLWLL